MTRRFALPIFLLLLSASLSHAQSPAARSADPGILVTDPGTGLLTAIGWRASLVLNVAAAAPSPADMITGPGGDLFFTTTSGSGCGPAATTHIYRASLGGPQAVIQQYTTLPIAAHHLAFDASTGDLFAAGTCDQTSDVYRIPANGVPQVLNAGLPFNDPDGLAFGAPSAFGRPQLFVATQDGLYVIDVLAPAPAITAVSVDLAGTGLATLGNWGFLRFDSRTGTLLGGHAGSPASYKTLELVFTGPSTAVASVVSPNTARPMATDERGARLFARGNELVFVNNPGPSATFRALFSGLAGSAVAVPAGSDSSFWLLDQGNGNVFRLEPSMRCDRLEISGAAGSVTTFRLKAPAGRAVENYLVLASASGSTPGGPFGTAFAPLNLDYLTPISMLMAITSSPYVPGWSAMLDAGGESTAQLVLPPGTALPGNTLSFCWFLGNPDFAANATWIHTIP